MPAPNIDIFESDSDVLGNGTPINDANPIAFDIVGRGATPKPIDEAQTPVHIWNDQTGAEGCDTATNVKLTVAAADNNNDILLFNGTELNGFKSMIEARSTAALGVAADAQSAWTPISPTDFLDIGDLPSNCRRSVELRANVPIDATTMTLTVLILSVNFI